VSDMSVQSCFLLHHIRVAGDYEDIKIIGVYRSYAEAEAAVHRAKERPGFRDSAESFSIDEYQFGKDHWTQGFISGDEIMPPDAEGE